MPYKSLLKKRSSSIGWALVVYYFVFSTLAVLGLLVPVFIAKIQAELDGRLLSAYEEQLLMDKMTQNAWGYLVAVCVGFLLVLLWKKKKFTFGTIFHQGKAMTVGAFVCLLALSLSGQLFFSIFANMLEGFLNIFGLSAQQATESATMTSLSFSMFLYTSIAAPIFEEIFFRGVVMRHLQPYGKRVALLGSAIAFGMFHGNIVQTPFAFFIGLFYGYAAMEYSIYWAMLLHMFNNLVLGDVFSRLAPLLGMQLMEGIFALIIYGSALAALVILIVKRDEIGKFRRQNRLIPGSLPAFLFSPGIVVFNILMGINMVLSLTVIE